MTELNSLKYISLVSYIDALSLKERVKMLKYVKDKLERDIEYENSMKQYKEATNLEDKLFGLGCALKSPPATEKIMNDLFKDNIQKIIKVATSDWCWGTFGLICLKGILRDVDENEEVPKSLVFVLNKIRKWLSLGDIYIDLARNFIYGIVTSVLRSTLHVKTFSELLFEFGNILKIDMLNSIFNKVLCGPFRVSLNYKNKILDNHIKNGVLSYLIKNGAWYTQDVYMTKENGILVHICKRLSIKHTNMDCDQMLNSINDLPLKKRVFVLPKSNTHDFENEQILELRAVTKSGKETGEVTTGIFGHFGVKVDFEGKTHIKAPRHSKKFGWSIIIEGTRYKISK